MLLETERDVTLRVFHAFLLLLREDYFSDILFSVSVSLFQMSPIYIFFQFTPLFLPILTVGSIIVLLLLFASAAAYSTKFLFIFPRFFLGYNDQEI